MQEQRGIIGSLPEILDFDHGPTPSANAIVGQQTHWTNMRNPAESQIADFMLSPSHLNDAFVNTINQEHPSFAGWNFEESSSSGAQDVVSRNEQKSEHVWSSSVTARAGAGPRLEERRHEQANILSMDVNMNPQFFETSDPSAVPQNLNLNARLVDHGDGSFHATEGPNPNMYNTSGVENELSSSANGSNASFIPSGNGERMVDENDVRSGCSLDVCHQSCKRKAIEGNVGSPSVGESSSFFQQREVSPWPSVLDRYSAESSLNVPAASQRAIPRLGLGWRSDSSESSSISPIEVDAETSHRNVRLRVNCSSQESAPTPMFSRGTPVRESMIPRLHQSLRHLAVGSFSLGLPPAVPNTASQSLLTVTSVPAVPQIGQSVRWNESSSMRPGSSSMAISVGESEQANSSLVRSLWDYPIPAPVNESQISVGDAVNGGVAGGISGVSGNAASTSQAGSSWGSHPLTAPSWVPPPNSSSRSSRRLAEYVRRSLLSSAIAESGGQGSPVQLRPAHTSRETSGPGSQLRRRSYPRSASWMDRQGEGPLGIHYPSRNFTAGSEGRSRLASEQIRNFLDLMRRGESLHFEDVMMLDQSVFFSVGDIHDRHRDMRLDVDNMSYEELLALEEQIGNVSTGLSEETIMKYLKQWKYSVAPTAEVEIEPCCICQEEYKNEEDLGTLDCGHVFHTDCIKQWLMHKNWCPICKTTGLSTS